MCANQWSCFVVLVVAAIAFGQPARAADDLAGEIESILDAVLEIGLGGPPGTEHANHFRPDNVASSGRIITALKNFIGANTATFPLSSTSTGVTFEFSGGVPVATSASAGPIFADRARTIGRNRLSIGANYSYLGLSKIRGVKTADARFYFLHEDVGAPGMGDSPFEFDYIDLMIGMDVDASVFVVQGSYGLLDNLDVGVSIPFVRVSLYAAPLAQITSFTYNHSGMAYHYFGGTSEAPVLTLRPEPVDATASGVGDIALRAKYNFHRGSQTDLSIQSEVRLPTGREEDFLGSGATSIRTLLIASKELGNLAPHANIGFDYRGSDYDNNEIEVAVGYDQKISETITLALDWLGEYEVGDAIDELQFPKPTAVGPTVDEEQLIVQVVPSTNIPNFHHDNVVNSSIGIKYTPRDNVILMANLLVPLNDGGLRSDVIPTLGLEMYF